MDPRPIAMAKMELNASTDAFLDALRPYRRVLPRAEFHRVADAMRGVADCIRKDPIDREALDILLHLLHTADAWALDPDGMLRRNKLISDEDQRVMGRWLGVLSEVLGRLVAGDEIDTAFKPYTDLRELDGDDG
jgi:transposase